MAFQILSGGLATTGTTGADLFSIVSGAETATTVLGLAGNDTIEAISFNTGTAVSINAAGGADTISLSGNGGVGNLNSSTIQGGAGADVINITGFTLTGSTVFGGDGDDTVTLSAFNNAGGSITLGGGSDSVTLATGTFNSSTVALGAGSDTLNWAFSGGLASAQVIGGGGADSITLSGNISGLNLSVNGDSSVNGGGNDTIIIRNVMSGATTIRGKGGADSITMSGFALTGGQVLGNAGGDTITVGANGALASAGLLFGLGAGNDSITFSGTVSDQTTSILGGGGTDTIAIGGDGAEFSGVIYGGAGADNIDFTAGDGTGSFVAFSATTDSQVSAGLFDTVDFASGMTFTVSAALGNAALTTGVVGGTDFNSGSTITNGVLSGTDFQSSEALTARVATIDGSATTQGNVVTFQDNAGNEYLFIQGGSSGTSDDLVVRLSGYTLSGIGVGSGSVSL